MSQVVWGRVPASPISIGRNGVIQTYGLDIEYGSHSLMLMPITSRGHPGNCLIEVPHTDILRVISALNHIIK